MQIEILRMTYYSHSKTIFFLGGGSTTNSLIVFWFLCAGMLANSYPSVGLHSEFMYMCTEYDDIHKHSIHNVKLFEIL